MESTPDDKRYLLRHTGELDVIPVNPLIRFKKRFRQMMQSTAWLDKRNPAKRSEPVYLDDESVDVGNRDLVVDIEVPRRIYNNADRGIQVSTSQSNKYEREDTGGYDRISARWQDGHREAKSKHRTEKKVDRNKSHYSQNAHRRIQKLGRDFMQLF